MEEADRDWGRSEQVAAGEGGLSAAWAADAGWSLCAVVVAMTDSCVIAWVGSLCTMRAVIGSFAGCAKVVVIVVADS